MGNFIKPSVKITINKSNYDNFNVSFIPQDIVGYPWYIVPILKSSNYSISNTKGYINNVITLYNYNVGFSPSVITSGLFYYDQIKNQIYYAEFFNGIMIKNYLSCMKKLELYCDDKAYGLLCCEEKSYFTSYKRFNLYIWIK